MMRFTSRTSRDGVLERLFDLDGVPGVLWTPQGSPGARPLIVIGHGGGQHKKAPGVVARAERFAREGGFAVVAIDAPNHGDRPQEPELTEIALRTRAAIAEGGDPAESIAAAQALLSRRIVPEWRALLDAVAGLDDVGPGPVGYWGVSLGCGLGVPFAAEDGRVRAAVLGLAGASFLAEDAARITVPVEFLVQWDDERIPREQSLALFDAFGSAEKTLHANPGGHLDLPPSETDSALRFFTRHLIGHGAAAAAADDSGPGQRWTAPEIQRTEPAGYGDGDEHQALKDFLQFHRDTLLLKCSGLSGEQLMLRAVPTSSLTLLGLVRHLAEVERWWFRRRFGQDRTVGDLYCSEEYKDGDFDLASAENAEADFATYRREVELADAVAAGRSLDESFPDGKLDLTLRWVYLHMIEEYARHNGHADMLREAIDGATGE